MSVCISSKGEFGSHTMDESGYVCKDCHEEDTTGLLAELAELRSRTTLPAPNGVRGNGEPAWHVRPAEPGDSTRVAGSVSPTSPTDEQDEDDRTVTLSVSTGQWPLAQARRLAAAILAAAEHQEDGRG